MARLVWLDGKVGCDVGGGRSLRQQLRRLLRLCRFLNGQAEVKWCLEAKRPHAHIGYLTLSREQRKCGLLAS